MNNAKNTNFLSVDALENVKLQGLSNTPVTSPNNICIDYLKIRFQGRFDPLIESWYPLLNALEVNHAIYDSDLKTSCYEKTYLYDANVFIMTGGSFTKDIEGRETTILELKGQACREFEARNGIWIRLFEEIIKLNGKCIRIDLALDNFNSLISPGSIVDKVHKKLYVSDWKKSPEIIYSSNNGFSITFGKYSDKTLCIYNKVAERTDRGYAVNQSDWIRYESRFKQECGDNAFSEVYCGMVDGTFDIVCKKLLRGLCDFKTGNKPVEDRKHLCRLSTWDKWEKLVDVEDRIVIRNQYKLETSILRKVNWIDRSASKSRLIMELFTTETFEELDGHFVYKHIDKLRNSDIALLNYALKTIGSDESYTLDSAKNLLIAKYEKYASVSDEGARFIGRYNSDTGEIL